MITGIRAIWRGIVDTYGDLFPMVGMNALWLLFSLPILFVLLFLVALLLPVLIQDAPLRDTAFALIGIVLATNLVVGPNPAASGIHLWANRLVNDERVEFGLFWDGLREYLKKASILFLISCLGFILLISNAVFYLQQQNGALQLFGLIWVYLILFWLCVQLYMLPLLIEQHDKRIKVVLRNSVVLALGNIFPSMTIVIFALIFLVLSAVLVLLIATITGSLTVMIAARVLSILLERHRGAAAARSG